MLFCIRFWNPKSYSTGGSRMASFRYIKCVCCNFLSMSLRFVPRTTTTAQKIKDRTIIARQWDVVLYRDRSEDVRTRFAIAFEYFPSTIAELIFDLRPRPIDLLVKRWLWHAVFFVARLRRRQYPTKNMMIKVAQKRMKKMVSRIDTPPSIVEVEVPNACGQNRESFGRLEFDNGDESTPRRYDLSVRRQSLDFRVDRIRAPTTVQSHHRTTGQPIRCY